MSIHLVGETMDRSRSHYLAGTGKLVQLMRGIYVDASDDIDQTVIGHAVRIARYLYPSAYLSAAGAVLLGPTRDGRLYLSGRRAQRTRIRGLEIVQNTAPERPSLGEAVVADSLGEFRVNVSSIRARFLEAFRLRSEHAASIDSTMRESIAARLIDEYGSPRAASDAVWALARENEWYREGEGAERFLLRRSAATPAPNQAALDLTVAWHGRPIGNLIHDGFEWRWSAKEAGTAWPPLIRQTTPGKLPPFVVSLLPEGWLESILDDRDERAVLRSGKRYMSNITIVERQDDLSALPLDVLRTRLVAHSEEGVFKGRYVGPGRSTTERNFERNLAQLYARAEMPRLSGVQIKAPMYLDPEGVISPSIETPFTHILKPAGTGGFEALPLVEWTALALGKKSGFSVPATALIDMPDGMPPALVVERFDIRDSDDDHRLLAMEDLCSVLDLPPSAKYAGTIERAARALRALSTDPEEDVLALVKRALFAWLIADGDMHLKNMAVLKTATPGESVFRSVRLAPLYDTVTTRVFPGLEHDRMALKLNGKDERLRRADFRALSRTVGLKVSDADAAIDSVLEKFRIALDAVSLPRLVAWPSGGEAAVDRMIQLCRERTVEFD
ncbi:type II toxin-antitoxin system HipA family toxin [Piscinibacter sp.]|uniref:type II toxin-antitoxin system HipA family toxin n=1 Tax=Piscinibacter sp. TaxID=1903157 RepID=UPI002B8FB840|nr:HipA domain-containing protein [Albitalea sp.]HUG26147.1 HipA domain-containing protein [Albitalea sp.]